MLRKLFTLLSFVLIASFVLTGCGPAGAGLALCRSGAVASGTDASSFGAA